MAGKAMAIRATVEWNGPKLSYWDGRRFTRDAGYVAGVPEGGVAARQAMDAARTFLKRGGSSDDYLDEILSFVPWDEATRECNKGTLPRGVD